MDIVLRAAFAYVFIVFLIPTVALASNHSFLGADGKSVSPIVYVGLFLFYVVAYTVVFFFKDILTPGHK